jgi:hypothetical protein
MRRTIHSVQVSKTELDWLVDMSHRRLSVSILEEAGRLGLKCLLLSYFRVGHNPPTTSIHALLVSPLHACSESISQHWPTSEDQ